MPVALPNWEGRLLRFLAAPRGTSWPLQWMLGRTGMWCVRCGGHEADAVPACKGCRAIVAPILAESRVTNDWTKRYRRDVPAAVIPSQHDRGRLPRTVRPRVS